MYPKSAADKSAELTDQRAQNERELTVKSFVGKLVKAEKDLAFYPTGNPAVHAAMRQCEETQSKALATSGNINLVTSKDQFFLDSCPLFADGAPERKLAAELFLLGVRCIRFTGEARAHDFERFLEALQEARKGPVSFQTILSVLHDRGIKGIELDQISNLEIVDESSLAEEIDLLLERIDDEAQAACDRSAIVNELYVRIVPGSLEPSHLARLLENPVRIKEAFRGLARAREGTAATSVATEVAARVLDSIGTAIDRAPLKERNRLYRTTAELLLNTADPLRTRLMMEAILPHVTSNSHEGALLRSLTDEELVELLAIHVPLHEGTLSLVSGSFRNLGLSLPKRQSILNLIKDKAAGTGAQSHRYGALFDALSTVSPSGSPEGSSHSSQDANRERALPPAESLELTQDEASQIADSVQAAGVSAKVENVPVLLDLLGIEEDPKRCQTVLDALEIIRNDAISEGNLRVALMVVEGYSRERAKRGLHATKVELIDRAIESASTRDTVLALAGTSLHLDRSSPEYGTVLDYLRAIQERAFHVLLERLEEENSRSLRLAIRGLLVALGKANTSALSSRVLHRRWFVARNAVSILGEIGGESSIEVLATALRHEEPRVRHEALNALGKIGGALAVQAIATALDDADDSVNLCAARWLTTLGEHAPIESLFAIIESSKFRRLDLETVLLAIRAVGQRDDANATSFLHKIARKRFAVLFASGRRIASCARGALREKASQQSYTA